MISPGTRASLEKYLADLERTDSTQVAVLTIPSLDGDAMSDFAIRVAEAWKVGQKGEDNGVILLVSKADRKIRIEVGYGLEGVLTDVLSSQIIRNVIGPNFKAGNYDNGFAEGVTAIAGAVRGEYTAAPAKKDPAQGAAFSRSSSFPCSCSSPSLKCSVGADDAASSPTARSSTVNADTALVSVPRHPPCSS